MILPRRYSWFVVVASLAVIAFLLLGRWQLGRLSERRVANASLLARRSLPTEAAERLARDTAVARFRALRVHGRFDYEHQFIWTARSREGAPGVVFLTPMIVSDSGPAVLVNRGWAYSADGMAIDEPLWREAVEDSVVGYADAFTSGVGPVFIGREPRRIRRLAFDSLQARLPYRLLPIIAVQQLGAGPQVEVRHPFRATPPPLDEGPHRGYALQWFAFAAITIVGTVAVVQRGRRPE
ncbi:MAG: SURF1 family protein [Gemmatimonadaceae bacterium]|nr:SURF1 family protein [Gemmatimonadaceae bacterium]